ncbi:MAG: hypothetical protein KAJ46_01620 [Sedimentisphaerales bacterium]|nr:hypothetical protein [Sedimentisphaerales bacterium]
MDKIPINIIFEDLLSEAVLRKLLEKSGQNYDIGISYNSGGSGWIRKRIAGFNNAAKGMPYLVLTDLDREECPPLLLDEWLGNHKHHNLLLRVAVREIESWILGCRTAFSDFVGIREELIPAEVDKIKDTKEYLISLVKKSRKRNLRSDIVPKEGSTARVGPDYNGRMIYFVEKFWEPYEARKYSPSLQRTMEVLSNFKPI